MTTTPAILYTSAGMPIGSLAGIHFYRITPTNVSINGENVSVALAPAFGGLAAGGADLGLVVVEKAAFSLKGKLVTRMDRIGPPSDKSLIRDDPDLSLTVQAGGIGTPSLMPGDAIEVSIGMKATSTNSAPAPIPASRWFIMNDGINYDSGDPTKFVLSLALDRQNSSPDLAEF